jgi:hypothetical protein
MSRTERDTTRIIRSWLEAGADRIPDRVLDAVEARLPATHQRRAGWLARRFSIMNTNTLRFGVAAAAVVVLALIGWQLLPGSNTGDGPERSSTPQSTASSAPTVPSLAGGELFPGTYRVTRNTIPLRITVPAGWRNVGGWAIAKDDAEGNNLAGISFWSPGQATQIYAHPCDWEANVMEPQGGVDATATAITEALAGQPLRGDAEPEDVSLDGHQGKVIELTLPGDLDFSTCDGGEPYSWLGRAHQGPGQVDRVYVIEVGTDLMVMDVSYVPEASSDVRQELETIVQSIDIE